MRIAGQEAVAGLLRCRTPTWNEEDFQSLLQKLGYVGYGWLRLDLRSSKKWPQTGPGHRHSHEEEPMADCQGVSTRKN